MGDAVFKRVASGHERGAGGRAGGADEKAGEPGALVVEFVEVRGLDPRVAVAPDGAVSLVIGHDENDVWFVGRSEEAGEEEAEDQEKVSGHGRMLPEYFGGSFLCLR